MNCQNCTYLIEDFALVGGSWVIRANINKMAAACKPVVLAKLICLRLFAREKEN